MRVIFAGTPDVAVRALDAILASRHEVVAVVTRPDAPAGRGRSLVASPVAARAALTGIETLTPARANDADFHQRLKELAPDCAPVVAYGGLIPRPALDIPKYGWINLHFSVLPAWRGAAPVQHAILHGDDVTGASTFRLEEGLDTGPVFGVVTEAIGPADTSGDLLSRLAISGATLLVATLDGIESGALRPTPQPTEGVSIAPKLSVDDAHIAWADPALHIDRQIRACTPAPGAWTEFSGTRIKVGPIALLGDHASLGPGEIAVEKNRLRVGTGSHEVVLGEVAAQGKKRMNAADWARGLRLESGGYLA